MVRRHANINERNLTPLWRLTHETSPERGQNAGGSDNKSPWSPDQGPRSAGGAAYTPRGRDVGWEFRKSTVLKNNYCPPSNQRRRLTDRRGDNGCFRGRGGGPRQCPNIVLGLQRFHAGVGKNRFYGRLLIQTEDVVWAVALQLDRAAAFTGLWYARAACAAQYGQPSKAGLPQKSISPVSAWDGQRQSLGLWRKLRKMGR